MLIFVPASFAVIFPGGWLLDDHGPAGEFFKETGFIAIKNRE
jgi:hypothetical protein